MNDSIDSFILYTLPRMKNKLHAFGFSALAALGALTSLYADQNLAGNVTVTGGSTSGNLIITGTVDVNGNGVTFGTQDTSFGASLLYTDSNTDTLSFFLNRAPASWLWQHTTIPAMRLDSNHKLLLYQPDGTTLGAAIDPGAFTLSLGTSTLYRDSSGALKTDGAFVVGGNFTAPTYTATNGTLTGGSTGLTLNAGGTNQSITFSASGTGKVVINSPVAITDTTASASPSTGALVVGGGVGASGDVNVAGAIKGDSVTVATVISGGAAGLSLNAGGANQSVTLNPSGTGVNRLQGQGTQIAGTTLFGTTTDSANGRVQLADHTTAAGGIGFGSDTVLYRSAVGTLKTDGKLTVSGAARFDSAVRIAPQGDLSMGEFTSEP